MQKEKRIISRILVLCFISAILFFGYNAYNCIKKIKLTNDSGVIN